MNTYLTSNLIFITLIGIIFVIVFIYTKKTRKNKIFSAKKIAFSAAFIALNVVLIIFSNLIGKIPIASNVLRSISDIPLVMSSLFLGPFFGLLIALIGNNIAFMIGGQIFFAGFLLNACLLGTVPFFIQKWIFKNNKTQNIMVIILNSIFLLGLISLWIFQILHVSFWNSLLNDILVSGLAGSAISIETFGFIIVGGLSTVFIFMSGVTLWSYFKKEKNTRFLQFFIMYALFLIIFAFALVPLYLQILYQIPFILSFASAIIIVPITTFFLAFVSDRLEFVLKKIVNANA